GRVPARSTLTPGTRYSSGTAGCLLTTRVSSSNRVMCCCTRSTTTVCTSTGDTSMHIGAASTGSRIGSTDPHGRLTRGAGETEHVPTELFAFRTTRLPATCRTEPVDHLLHQLTEASCVAHSIPASHAAGVLGALTERDRNQQDKSLRHPLLPPSARYVS